MRNPTDQDIAKARADATEKGHRGALELLEFGEPVDVALVVAPFDRASYANYIDAMHRDVLTAHGGVYASRVMWPSLGEALSLRDLWPSLPSIVAKELEIVAGWASELATVEQLVASKLPDWIEPSKAHGLFGRRGRTLWSVELRSQDLYCIMESPLPDTWLAAVAADKAARAAGKNVIGAVDSYILETVAWAPVSIETQLERRPALISDLRRAYLRMGGEGAAVRRKSL